MASTSIYLVGEIISNIIFNINLKYKFLENNCKNITEAVKTFYWRGRLSLSGGACQKSCESNQNWGSFRHKETAYFKEASL